MRHTIFWLVVLLGGCTVGCASSEAPLVFSYHGSPAGLVAAQAAAGQWEACGRTIIVGVDNGGLPLVEQEGMLPGPLLGEVVSDEDFAPKRMYVSRQTDPAIEIEIMAHEFGHALGIKGHVESGLMAESYAPGLHVTPADCGLLP